MGNFLSQVARQGTCRSQKHTKSWRLSFRRRRSSSHSSAATARFVSMHWFGYASVSMATAGSQGRVQWMLNISISGRRLYLSFRWIPYRTKTSPDESLYLLLTFYYVFFFLFSLHENNKKSRISSLWHDYHFKPSICTASCRHVRYKIQLGHFRNDLKVVLLFLARTSSGGTARNRRQAFETAGNPPEQHTLLWFGVKRMEGNLLLSRRLSGTSC